jgi:hypothetical protein
MPAFKRWTIHDANGTYTFFPNPNGMTSPFPARNISAKVTTAVDGQVLMFEGGRQAKEWTFSGDIIDAEQYEALRSWVFDRLGTRVQVSDHFGRVIDCVLTDFKPTPKRAVGKYWRHTYEVSALVTHVGAPTVGEVPA